MKCDKFIGLLKTFTGLHIRSTTFFLNLLPLQNIAILNLIVPEQIENQYLDPLKRTKFLIKLLSLLKIS